MLILLAEKITILLHTRMRACVRLIDSLHYAATGAAACGLAELFARKRA